MMYDDRDFTFDDLDTPAIEPKLRRAQSLVGTSAGRPEHDFYPTPPAATEALLAFETFEGEIWEPACGDGAISEVLKAHHYSVVSSDLIDRGYGLGGVDFLTSETRSVNIITNPPFSLGQAFVEHALARTTGKVAMLCKLAFLEGAKRRKMFESTPLETVYVFSKRLTMSRNGKKLKNSGMLAFAWLVWRHGYAGPPRLAWL